MSKKQQAKKKAVEARQERQARRVVKGLMIAFIILAVMFIAVASFM